MTRILFVIAVLAVTAGSVTGQEYQERYLLLQKAGTQKRVIFLEGDEIRYKLRGDDQFRRNYILGLRKDTIRFHYHEVALAEIEVIDIRRKGFQNFHFDSGGNKVIIAGLLFLTADVINKELIQDEPGGISGQTFAITGAIVGAGVLIKLLEKRKFRPGGRYIIDIIDLRNR